MAIFCEDCGGYTNQVCEKCGQTFGTTDCEIYGCGGKMTCTKCGSSNLNAGKRPPRDPLDKRWEQSATIPKCDCGYEMDSNWKFCPMCGKAV